MAMLGAAWGLRASALCSTVPRALVLGLLYVLGYALLPLSLLFVTGAAAFYAAPFLHPLYSAYTLVFTKVESDSIWGYAWIGSSIASFVAARYIVGGVGLLIERKVRSPLAPLVPVYQDLPAPPPSLRSVYGTKDVSLRMTREVWEGDPLLWKDLVTRGGNRWSSDVKSMFLVYSLIFIVLCWLFSRGNSLGTFSFLGALFAVLSLVNGASLFAPEKEGRKMEMLLSAPIASGRIVRSKLLAGLMSPESIRILLLALLTSVAFSWWSGPGIFLYVGVLLVFLLFVFTLSAAASLHADTLQGAALASAGILCVLLLVLPILVSILTPSADLGGSLPLPLLLLSALNPVAILEPLDLDRGAGLAQAFARFLVFAAVYGSATAGLGGLMLWRFDRYMGRL